VVGFTGYPLRTGTGELSIAPVHAVLLAPCMQEIPHHLTDPDIRFRQRYLDMLVNPSVIATLHTKAKVCEDPLYLSIVTCVNGAIFTVLMDSQRVCCVPLRSFNPCASS